MPFNNAPLGLHHTKEKRNGRTLWRTSLAVRYDLNLTVDDRGLLRHTPNIRHTVFSFKIPIGFYTDLASIPRLMQFFLPPSGKHAKAAVLHDFLYKNHHGLSRSMADHIFWEAMLEEGVKPITAFFMWVAVRAFGRKAWEEKR